MTTIQWTDETWNPVTGCTRVSEGCRHCYIETTPPFRMHGRKLGDPIQLHPDRLDAPLHWKKPRRVFVNSLSDLFHEDVPDEFMVSVYAVMVAAYQHTFQVLTKRPDRRRQLLSLCSFREQVAYESAKAINKLREPHSLQATQNLAYWNFDASKNIHEGVSIENQQTADERIPILLQTSASVRWVSYEPALGPVDLTRYLAGEPRLNWIVVGGESGMKARPCDLAWIRSVVEQSKTAGVPVFVKQLGRIVLDGHVGRSGNVTAQSAWRFADRKGGDPAEWPADLRVRQYPR